MIVKHSRDRMVNEERREIGVRVMDAFSCIITSAA